MKTVTLGLILFAFAYTVPLHADEVASVQMIGSAVDFGQAAITMDFLWDVTAGSLIGPTGISTFGLPSFAFTGVTLSNNKYDFAFVNAVGDTWNMFTFPDLIPAGNGGGQLVPYQFLAGESGGIQDSLTCGSPTDECSLGNLEGFYPLHGEITTLSVTEVTNSVPEPKMIILLTAGFACVALALWRKQFHSSKN